MREYEAMIQSVSPKQIAEFTRLLLSSKPSLAAFGDGTDVLNYDNLMQRYADANWSQRSSNPMGVGASPYADGQMSQNVFEMLKKGLSMGGGRSMASSSSSGSGTVSSSPGSSSRSSGESSSGSS